MDTKMSNDTLSAKKTATLLALMALVGVGGFVAGLQTGMSGHAGGDESCEYWKEVKVAGPIERVKTDSDHISDAELMGEIDSSEFLTWSWTTKLVCADDEVEESIAMAVQEDDDPEATDKKAVATAPVTPKDTATPAAAATK